MYSFMYHFEAIKKKKKSWQCVSKPIHCDTYRVSKKSSSIIRYNNFGHIAPPLVLTKSRKALIYKSCKFISTNNAKRQLWTGHIFNLNF